MAKIDIQDIETRLWAAADELRANSGLKESEYSVPALGLIFLKYADSHFSAVEAELADARPVEEAGRESGPRHRHAPRGCGGKRLTPNRHRTAVSMLRERFGVSERRACKVVGIHRSTQRLAPPPVTDDEAELRAFLRRFSTQRPRWGWRRAAKEARRQSRKVSDKRIRRLWREEGLRVPHQRRNKRLSGVGVHVGAMCPIRPNVPWVLDFQFDTPSEFATKWTTINQPQAA